MIWWIQPSTPDNDMRKDIIRWHFSTTTVSSSVQNSSTVDDFCSGNMQEHCRRTMPYSTSPNAIFFIYFVRKCYKLPVCGTFKTMDILKTSKRLNINKIFNVINSTRPAIQPTFQKRKKQPTVLLASAHLTLSLRKAFWASRYNEMKVSLNTFSHKFRIPCTLYLILWILSIEFMLYRKDIWDIGFQHALRVLRQHRYFKIF